MCTLSTKRTADAETCILAEQSHAAQFGKDSQKKRYAHNTLSSCKQLSELAQPDQQSDGVLWLHVSGAAVRAFKLIGAQRTTAALSLKDGMSVSQDVLALSQKHLT